MRNFIREIVTFGILRKVYFGRKIDRIAPQRPLCEIYPFLKKEVPHDMSLIFDEKDHLCFSIRRENLLSAYVIKTSFFGQIKNSDDGQFIEGEFRYDLTSKILVIPGLLLLLSEVFVKFELPQGFIFGAVILILFQIVLLLFDMENLVNERRVIQVLAAA
jgi:hypothetical protein